MIGHTGITDSEGVVHDFQGPYTIVTDSMMLGRACRYLPLDPSKVCAVAEGSTPEERWDACIEQGDADFRKKIHCLLYPNCNHHVAHCLNCCKVREGAEPCERMSRAETGVACGQASMNGCMRMPLCNIVRVHALSRKLRLVLLFPDELMSVTLAVQRLGELRNVSALVHDLFPRKVLRGVRVPNGHGPVLSSMHHCSGDTGPEGHLISTSLLVGDTDSVLGA